MFWEKAVSKYSDVDHQINYIYLAYSIKSEDHESILNLLIKRYELDEEEIKILKIALDYGFASSGKVSRTLRISHPTARKKIIRLAEKLGIEDKLRRTHTRFSWYCINRSTLIDLALSLLS